MNAAPNATVMMALLNFIAEVLTNEADRRRAVDGGRKAREFGGESGVALALRSPVVSCSFFFPWQPQRGGKGGCAVVGDAVVLVERIHAFHRRIVFGSE